eukprot:2244556-Rhodomonas_salina.2
MAFSRRQGHGSVNRDALVAGHVVRTVSTLDELCDAARDRTGAAQQGANVGRARGRTLFAAARARRRSGQRRKLTRRAASSSSGGRGAGAVGAAQSARPSCSRRPPAADFLPFLYPCGP